MRDVNPEREYLYFSKRMVSELLKDSGYSGSDTTTSTLTIGGPHLGWSRSRSRGAPKTKHEKAQAVDRLLQDQAVYGWDDNEQATYVRGRGRAFLAELRPWWGEAPEFAMVGSTYLWEGAKIHLCLFGSWSNLKGTYAKQAGKRAKGWHSSSNQGIEALFGFARAVKAGGPVAAELGGKDDADEYHSLVFNAANIMTGQGLVGDGNRPNATAPSLRGYTIGEGDLEWVARIYWWRSHVLQFGHVAVGAPLYVRTVSGCQFDQYASELNSTDPLLDGRTPPVMKHMR